MTFPNIALSFEATLLRDERPRACLRRRRGRSLHRDRRRRRRDAPRVAGAVDDRTWIRDEAAPRHPAPLLRLRGAGRPRGAGPLARGRAPEREARGGGAGDLRALPLAPGADRARL